MAFADGSPSSEPWAEIPCNLEGAIARLQGGAALHRLYIKLALPLVETVVRSRQLTCHSPLLFAPPTSPNHLPQRDAMKTTAFVSGSAFLPRTTLSAPLAASPVANRRLVTAAPARQHAVIVRMSADENKKIPQGFTSYSELLNGRAA